MLMTGVPVALKAAKCVVNLTVQVRMVRPRKFDTSASDHLHLTSSAVRSLRCFCQFELIAVSSAVGDFGLHEASPVPEDPMLTRKSAIGVRSHSLLLSYAHLDMLPSLDKVNNSHLSRELHKERLNVTFAGSQFEFTALPARATADYPTP